MDPSKSLAILKREALVRGAPDGLAVARNIRTDDLDVSGHPVDPLSLQGKIQEGKRVRSREQSSGRGGIIEKDVSRIFDPVLICIDLGAAPGRRACRGARPPDSGRQGAEMVPRYTRRFPAQAGTR